MNSSFYVIILSEQFEVVLNYHLRPADTHQLIVPCISTSYVDYCFSIHGPDVQKGLPQNLWSTEHFQECAESISDHTDMASVNFGF